VSRSVTLIGANASGTCSCHTSIAATFERRRTPLPTAPPLALAAAFADDRARQVQWRAFVARGRLDLGEPNLGEVVAFLRDFLLPPAVAAESRKPFDSFWPAGGPWQAWSDGRH
jgi:hypothetical protein